MLTPDHQRVVVLGSSFAGLTAALELRKHLARAPRGRRARPARPLHLHPLADLAAVRPPPTRRHHLPARPALREQGHPLRQRGGRPHRHRGARDHHHFGRRAALRPAADRDRAAPGVREDPRPRARARPHAIGVQPRPRPAGRGGLGVLPGEPRPGRGRHRPGRLVLRRLLRVPLQHPPPHQEGRSGRRRAGDLRLGRALPRPLRPRRGRRLLQARHQVLRPPRHRGPAEHRHQRGPRR